MALLASIGDLPDTITDRAIVVRMRRRGPDEKVSPFRTRRDAPRLHELRAQLNTWIREHLAVLQSATPAMPVEDRAADTWESLFAIAELAGGDWPAAARRACLELTGEEPADASIHIRLLADLEEIWPDTEPELFTSTILARLHTIEEAPWQTWGRGREPMNANGLSRLLHVYRISSRNVRIDAEQKKGYHRADLQDAWSRYAPRPAQGSAEAEPQDDPQAGAGQPTTAQEQVPRCQLCSAALWAPDSQKRGLCARCHRETDTQGNQERQDA
jgi:hypothetical protein